MLFFDVQIKMFNVKVQTIEMFKFSELFLTLNNVTHNMFFFDLSYIYKL